jgi:hypothetical protein
VADPPGKWSRIPKAGWGLGYVSRLIPSGEESGLLTHIATTESV